MMHVAKILGLGVLLAAGHAQAADSICPRLKGFVRQQMAETSDPAPRHFVEFHWGQDSDAIFSTGCRHSEDSGSAEFCHWLMDNTSWEFRSRLPINILRCFGYRFPNDPTGDWPCTTASSVTNIPTETGSRWSWHPKGCRERKRLCVFMSTASIENSNRMNSILSRTWYRPMAAVPNDR